MKTSIATELSKPRPASTRGETMNGAEILVAAMEREGVEVIFAYPGGASMPIHQALTRSTKIRTILPRHEQGGSFAAEGYARATGPAGCLHGDFRARSNQPGHWDCGRLHGLYTARRDYRPSPARDDRTRGVPGNGRVSG